MSFISVRDRLRPVDNYRIFIEQLNKPMELPPLPPTQERTPTTARPELGQRVGHDRQRRDHRPATGDGGDDDGGDDPDDEALARIFLSPIEAALTVEETARFLRLNARTIREMVKKGEIAGNKRGHAIRISKNSVTNWLSGKTPISRSGRKSP